MSINHVIHGISYLRFRGFELLFVTDFVIHHFYSSILQPPSRKTSHATQSLLFRPQSLKPATFISLAALNPPESEAAAQ